MISEKWLNAQKTLRDATKPGAARDTLTAEIEAAEKQLAAEKAIVRALAVKGYRRNQRAGRCAVSGVEVREQAGFIRDDGRGKWELVSWDVAAATLR
jgi:hypothetical protein